MFDALRRLLDSWRDGRSPEPDGDGAGPDPLSCEEALERLFAYLDGELEEAQRERVAEHFEVCRRCYPRLEFERSFMEAVRRVRGGDSASAALKSRVLEALRDEGLDPR